jgi:hypothetical protein
MIQIETKIQNIVDDINWNINKWLGTMYTDTLNYGKRKYI